MRKITSPVSTSCKNTVPTPVIVVLPVVDVAVPVSDTSVGLMFAVKVAPTLSTDFTSLSKSKPAFMLISKSPSLNFFVASVP